MSRMYDNEKKSNKSIWFLILFLALGFTFYNYRNGFSDLSKDKTQTIKFPTSFNSHVVPISRNGSTEKLNSHFSTLNFKQTPSSSGISADEYSLQFEAPVKVWGISLDFSCTHDLNQINVAAALNEKPVYPNDVARNVLAHASCRALNESESVNQTVWLSQPLELEADKSLNWGTSLENSSLKDMEASINVVLYYSWVDQQPASVEAPAWRPRKR